MSTLGELAVFLKENELSLHVEYSAEREAWVARLKLTTQRNRGGVVSTSAPAETMIEAVERAVDLWEHR